MIDKKAIEEHIRGILVALGDDPNREGLIDTPKRVAQMYEEVFEGMNYTNEEIAHMFDKTFSEDYRSSSSDVVLVKDINVFSYCEHHMALLLQSVIGNLGLGYYQSAYNYYTIILLISSYSIPSAISKAIAQKLGEKEYRNAHRLFHGAMIYVLVVGGIASLFLFFGAGLFVSGAAVTVLRTFAPTIFVYGILGVLRGYFQAHKSMAQTSVSQILEQIANAVVSVGAAYLLIQMFMGTMEVPADQAGQVMRATYGAVGSALGTGVGVLVALLFMAGVYALNRGMILRRVQRDRHEHVDSYGQIFKTITLVVTPFILSTAVYNLSSTVNNSIYTKWYPSLRNLDTVSIYEKYGIFSGQSLTMQQYVI